MADDELFDKVQGLSDIELALLLSLVSREHCILSTVPTVVDELVEELQLIASRTFGLSCVVINCHPHMTLDDFASSLLLNPSPPTRAPSPALPQVYHHHHYHGGASSHIRSGTSATLAPGTGSSPNPDYFYQERGGGGHVGVVAPLSPLFASTGSPPSHRGSASHSNNNNNNTTAATMANVVLARDLDAAPRAVQAQALELLRTRRLFARGGVYPAPRSAFIVVPVLGALSGGVARLGGHLDDFFFVAHWHDVDDGFPYLDGDADDDDDDDDDGDRGWRTDVEGSLPDTASTESVVKKSAAGDKIEEPPVFTEKDISRLASLSREVHVDVDVHRYQMNVVAFLRMHRAVAGGATPTATQHLGRLVRCLAPLHRLDYVTPALVGLAARKVYLHRVRVAAHAENDRSLQWGGSRAAVEAVLEHVGPEDVIEDVLEMVTAPL